MDLDQLVYTDIPQYTPELTEIDYNAVEGPVQAYVEAAGAGAASLTGTATATVEVSTSYVEAAGAGAASLTGTASTEVSTAIFAWGSASSTLLAHAVAHATRLAYGAGGAELSSYGDAAVTSRVVRWIRPRQVLLRPAMTATPMVKPQ